LGFNVFEAKLNLYINCGRGIAIVINSQLLETIETRPPLARTERRKWIAHCLGWLFLILCCIPFFTYCYLIPAVGANNISNDYLNFTPLIEPIFSGNYNWGRFLSDTFVGTHCEMVGTLVHLAVAKWIAWDARAELYIALGLTLIRALLLCSILSEPNDGKWKYWLFGGIFALVFSLSQSSLFFYGETGFPIGISLLGFTIGLFGIVKFRHQPWLASASILAGGFLSSLSWGNFLPCWICLFLGLIILDYKSKPVYAACVTGTLTSVAIYLYIRLQDFSFATSTLSLASLHNWHLWLNLLGRPFCNDAGILLVMLRFSTLTGLFAVSASLLSLSLLLFQKKIGSRAISAIVLIIYALLSCWLISIFRNVLAPWYTAIAMNLWIGLWGLTISLLRSSKSEPIAHQSVLEKAVPIAGVSTILTMSVLYIWTNRTYEDKQFFMQTRAPVSESTIRHFRTAPTYCEQFAFQWGDGKYRFLEQLAKPLEKYHLSCFSDRQEWALQGDFPLDNVQILETKPIFWTDCMQLLNFGEKRERTDWRSYKHLNLGLPEHTQVTWTIDLPDNLLSATLITAFGVTQNPPVIEVSRPSITQLTIAGEQSDKTASSMDPLYMHAALVHPGKWYPVSIPLTSYKGKKITLRFSSTSNEQNQTHFALFQYPHINVSLAKTAARSAVAKTFTAYKPVMQEFPIDPDMKPSNTDLSPDMVQETPDDYCFPGITSNFWHNQIFTENELVVNGTAQGTQDKSSPLLCSQHQLDIHLHTYSHLQVEAQTQMPLKDCRSLFVALNYADGSSYRFSLPLLPDGNMHKYSYDFKITDYKNDPILDQIFFRPVNKSGEPLSSTIRIKSVRLIHK
jgi:hypothetical protein